MEIVKVTTKSDVVSTICSQSNMSSPSTRQKKSIVSEEEYTKKMEQIITHDFFPDLPKLRAQNAYLEAVEKGDVARIQEIQLAYRLTESTRSRVVSVRSTACTPVTFETPDVRRSDDSPKTESLFGGTFSVVSESDKPKKTLDQFLSGTTSEDNASFQQVMEKSQLQHEKKYPWLYRDEQRESHLINDALALPSTAQRSALENVKEVVTWKYKNRNALMYVPDGVEFTPEEILAMETHRKEISHINTRFEAPPFDEEANKEAIAEAATLQAKMKEGRVGIDGKEIVPGDSPQVNGFGFVGTPVPQPGVTDTPIMTWGEIEGTPFRLDGSDTPLPQTPSHQQFRIPNLSARERIALSLADKAAKKHRKPKKVPTDLPSPSLKFGTSTPLTERLQSMSPAARKLAFAKLGIQRDSDRALRASYSPSPLRTPNSCAVTPSSTPIPTPSPKTTVITPSRTEALLHAPKRHKASDFF